MCFFYHPQVKLNGLMSATPNGRCFVRPSGTEDVVRIYAEANTQVYQESVGV
jgi:phosphoacetylglucosamine mutase